jgi:hypothetical protein
MITPEGLNPPTIRVGQGKSRRVVGIHVTAYTLQIQTALEDGGGTITLELGVGNQLRDRLLMALGQEAEAFDRSL